MLLENKYKFWLGGKIFGYSAKESEVFRILEKLQKQSLIAIDTSSSYSEGYSERIIGNWIKSNLVPRNDFFLATKIGLKSHQKSDGFSSSKNILATLNGSLDRLNTNYVDVLFLHAHDPVTPIEESINTLINLKNVGMIKGYGVCNVDAITLANYMRVVVENGGSLNDFYVQNYFNWAKRSLDYWLTLKELTSYSLWKSASYGILGRGVLTEIPVVIDKNSRKSVNKTIVKDSSSPENIRFLNHVKKICRQYNLTLYDFSLAFAARGSDHCIIGIRTEKQIEEFLAYNSKKIPSEVIYDISTEFSMSYLEGLNWHLGDPETTLRI
jgi:aryl-alcohol dehydrogenase-like predicted oxidoreductase